MSRRNNFNGEPPETHRSSNFERRLRETNNSELEPEQVTPNSAGAEELPEYEQVFTLPRQFQQTNMRSTRGRRKNGDSQTQTQSQE